MKKITIQITLIVCISIEVFSIYKMFETSNVMHQQLFSGLTVFFLLIIFKTLANLTETNHGN